MAPPISIDIPSGLFTVRAFCLLVSFASCIYVLFRRYASGGDLRKVPGPFVASFSPLWMTYHAWIGDVHRKNVELHRKHGPAVRVGPNEVSITDLEAVRNIYGRPCLKCIHSLLTKAGQVQVANSRRATFTAYFRAIVNSISSAKDRERSTAHTGVWLARYIRPNLSRTLSPMSTKLSTSSSIR